MSPYQSWSTFLLLALCVVCVLWLAYELTKRDDAKNDAPAPTDESAEAEDIQPEDEPAVEQSAVVAEAVASLRGELSRLEPDEVAEILGETTGPELFDWKKQGI